MNESESNGKIAGMLIEQYKIQRQEVLAMVTFYKTHIRNFQLLAGAILGATAFFLSRPELLPTAKTWWLWWSFLTFLPIVATYLLLDTLSPVYVMSILAERMANIERQLNERAGQRIFVWEEYISRLFNRYRNPIKGVVNPDWFLAVFGGVIYITMAVVVPCWGYYTIWTASGFNNDWLSHTMVAGGLLLVVVCCTITSYVSAALMGLRRLFGDWLNGVVSGTTLKAGDRCEADNDEGYHKNKEKDHQKGGALVDKRLDTEDRADKPKQKQQDAGEEMRHYRRLEVVFTGVTALMTLIYAIFAGGLWYETKRALVLTERPWISLETGNYATPTNKTLYVVANMRSTGRSPIVDFHVAADAYIAKPGVVGLLHGVTRRFWEPQRNFGPGQAIPLELTFTFPEDIASLVANGASPNISINVRYTDQLGNSFPQPFCFYFPEGKHEPKYCGEREVDPPQAKLPPTLPPRRPAGQGSAPALGGWGRLLAGPGTRLSLRRPPPPPTDL